MNWEMIGAVGEVLGAAGVIVTLVYLARQIRSSSTQASRQAAGREITEGTRVILSQIAQDRESAKLWRRGLAADDQLSLVDPWILETHLTTRQNIAGTPGFRAWFEARKEWLSADFRNVLEADVRRRSDYRPFGLGPEQDPQSGPNALGSEPAA